MQEDHNKNRVHLFKKRLVKNFGKMTNRFVYKIALILLGIPTFIMLLIMKGTEHGEKENRALKEEIIARKKEEGQFAEFYQKALDSEKCRNEFFRSGTSQAEMERRAGKKAEASFSQVVNDELRQEMLCLNRKENTFASQFEKILSSPPLLFISVVTCLPMYALILIYSNPFIKYIFERIIMMIFVVFGVTFFVFTILHFSPSDPAMNILGERATQQQITEFNQIYGLDKPYIVQLLGNFKRLISFDLGNSYVGNENVLTAIGRKFPITLRLAFMSLIVSVLIAIPAGIISAVRQYSAFDYTSMFVALLGLSIPNFWLGLIMILTFSIRLGWLPAIYDEGNWMTLIMPAIVIGTGMAASMSRMTRSSMLEVKNQDFVMTARAKGLSERKVVLKHILGNAMIPIVTIVGLQFGSMLGGSAVTEKVFNVNGIGSYIVDKQFIPDIPVVLAGVVYVALIISIINLAVDILYACLDPRIKSKMKNY